jgi:hypothetical protein
MQCRWYSIVVSVTGCCSSQYDTHRTVVYCTVDTFQHKKRGTKPQTDFKCLSLLSLHCYWMLTFQGILSGVIPVQDLFISPEIPVTIIMVDHVLIKSLLSCRAMCKGQDNTRVALTRPFKCLEKTWDFCRAWSTLAIGWRLSWCWPQKHVNFSVLLFRDLVKPWPLADRPYQSRGPMPYCVTAYLLPHTPVCVPFSCSSYCQVSIKTFPST